MTNSTHNQDTCVSEVVDIEQKGTRIRWGGCYPVLLLAEPGQPSRLPPQRLNLKKPGVEPALTGSDDTLIIGERSSGIRDLLAWWCNTLDEGKHPWLLARGDSWDPDFFDWSEQFSSAKDAPEAKKWADLKEKIGVFATDFGTPDGLSPLLRAKHLMELETVLNESALIPHRFTMIMRQLSTLPAPAAAQCAEALAVIRDNARCERLRFVIADSHESIYQPKPDISGIQRFCFIYRPAHWDRPSINALAESIFYKEPIKVLTDDAIDEIIRFTGGQPLLVNDLLRRLRLLDDTDIGANQMLYVTRQMRANPPSQTRAWEQTLREILTADPRLIEPMKRYASNESLGPAKFPPPTAERVLFINGWLRLNEAQRWGITSEMHRQLARPIIDDCEEE